MEWAESGEASSKLVFRNRFHDGPQNVASCYCTPEHITMHPIPVALANICGLMRSSFLSYDAAATDPMDSVLDADCLGFHGWRGCTPDQLACHMSGTLSEDEPCLQYLLHAGINRGLTNGPPDETAIICRQSSVEIGFSIITSKEITSSHMPSISSWTCSTPLDRSVCSLRPTAGTTAESAVLQQPRDSSESLHPLSQPPISFLLCSWLLKRVAFCRFSQQ
ncbi:hypothetical protein BJX70DRAFT_56992 [Aspergillus crustosus]